MCMVVCRQSLRAVIKISIAPLPPDVYEVVLVRERAALGHAEISRAVPPTMIFEEKSGSQSRALSNELCSLPGVGPPLAYIF
jgi:endonuclease III